MSVLKLKIGDRVRVKEHCSEGCFLGVLGTVYRISRGDHCVCINTDSGYQSGAINIDRYLELAAPYPNPPHKHAELIKAWADGADIEIYITVTGAWQASPSPSWVKSYTYRIKPTKSAKDVKLEELEANMRKLADEIKELRNE